LNQSLYHVAAARFERFAANQPRALALVGCTSILVGVLLVGVGRLPIPRIHDEFSYLLAADTFAHGRATNPAHPLWVHFESFHIIQQPTYSSKYPVGQGMALAAGQLLTRYPIVGVWLSIAAACMAVCWMLRAWVSPSWALVGGLLAAMHPQVMRWNHNYWGGAIAMLGGALLVGAARRLVDRPQARHAIAAGLGLALLANSRPFEGALLGLLVGGVVLIWLISPAGPPWRVSLARVIAPVLGVLVATGAAMGYHHWRVTGDPLLMPYVLHEETYAVAPPFGWQRMRQPPSYHHDVIRRYWVEGWERGSTPESRHPVAAPATVIAPNFARSFRRNRWVRRYRVGMEALGRAYGLNLGLVLVLVGLPLLVRDRAMQVAGAVLALGSAGVLLGSWFQPHYAAPLVGLAFLLPVAAMQALWTRRAGRYLVVGALLLGGAMFVRHVGLIAETDRQTAGTWFSERARIQADLESSGKKSLVVVRYQPDHFVIEEWVYNDADIDASPVVWAREMDAAHNEQLLEYFGTRRIWLLEADVQPWRLVPYPQASSARATR
jgi:hypothetical protein